jgi:hypothetical protein
MAKHQRKPPGPLRDTVTAWLSMNAQRNSDASSLRRKASFVPPFPFPPRGKPGPVGRPHAAKTAAPPTRGRAPPLCIPRSGKLQSVVLGNLYLVTESALLNAERNGRRTDHSADYDHDWLRTRRRVGGELNIELIHSVHKCWGRPVETDDRGLILLLSGAIVLIAADKLVPVLRTIASRYRHAG